MADAEFLDKRNFQVVDTDRRFAGQADDSTIIGVDQIVVFQGSTVLRCERSECLLSGPGPDCGATVFDLRKKRPHQIRKNMLCHLRSEGQQVLTAAGVGT